MGKSIRFEETELKSNVITGALKLSRAGREKQLRMARKTVGPRTEWNFS